MRMSRRSLLALGLGAAQLALLERFGQNRAHAGPSAGGPTKLLSIYLPGGVHHELFWGALTAAGVAKYIPAPVGGFRPVFYNADQVKNFDGSSGDGGEYRKVRGPVHWNPANPADRTGANPESGGTQNYCPWGYAWAAPEYKLYERTALIHGVDQGTAAHQSGIVASLCGAAGANFRAPSIQSVVANAMVSRFPDRPLPNVSLKSQVVTSALDLPSTASPIYLNDVGNLSYTVSDYPGGAWDGLRERHAIDGVGFDGATTGSTLPATVLDEAALGAIRLTRGRSSAGTDAALEQLYNSYAGYSRTLARDVVDILTKTKGVEHLPEHMPWAPDQARFGYVIGYADGGTSTYYDQDIDLVLRLLKSDLATSVTFRCAGANNFAFDTHFANAHQLHSDHLHGMMDVVGRLLIEMMLTPVAGGKTLLDDTLVYIFSEFGRTFPQQGSDHHPTNTAVLVGGNVMGNRMIGGYDETIPGTPLGLPIEIREIEAKEKPITSRVPRAADVVATIARSFGLEAGADFFIPGGYGEVVGVLPE